MTLGLSQLKDCFEGIIPSIVATVDTDGVPNASYLSQVFFVDAEHVALSNQFFSKTAANVRATGRATLLAVDGRTGVQYHFHLTFERAIHDGGLFARMAADLKAISSQHGMENLMALKSADLYRVDAITPVYQPVPAEEKVDDRQPSIGGRLAAAAAIVAEISASSDPDAMLDLALDRLTTDLGWNNVMMLAPDASGTRMAILASRGYPEESVGAEIRLGEGVIGISAAARQPVRINDVSRGNRMASAVSASMPEYDRQRTIAMPGLAAPQSQIAVPMVAFGELMGIVFAESAERFFFSCEDEGLLVMLGAQIAALLHAAEDGREDVSPAQTKPAVAALSKSFRVRHYDFDDSLFIDDQYIIKGVPGRLLFLFLKSYTDGARTLFTNRELRLDPRLRLPDFKDNLETRLILLRRRLDEKNAPVRLSRPGRGLVGLELAGTPILNSE